MILEAGDNVLVSHRRLFEGDEARYFIGRVIACEGPLVKAEGFSFVRDLSNGHIIKKKEMRTKLFSIASAAHIIYQLQEETELEGFDIVSRNSDAVLVAGSQSLMNLAEHTHCGQF